MLPMSSVKSLIVLKHENVFFFVTNISFVHSEFRAFFKTKLSLLVGHEVQWIILSE
jgi:hypothetical protein